MKWHVICLVTVFLLVVGPIEYASLPVTDRGPFCAPFVITVLASHHSDSYLLLWAHWSAVVWAYGACPGAANALLTTHGISRSRHSSMIAAFRQRFVKSGLIEAKYSDVYGRVMENRHVSDYEIELPVEPQVAEDGLRDAQRFVERVEQHLREEGWL